MATNMTSRAPAADLPRDTEDDEDGPGSEPDPVDRTHVIYARHQWFAFVVFGAICCASALIFSRWNPSPAEGRWFWVVLGPIVGVVAMFRSQSVFGGEGADRDAGPYIGVLVGTTLGAVVVGWLALDGWVLPGVFFAVAAFLALMAWLEQSAIGTTSALTMTVLAACTAATDLGRSSVTLSLGLGLMFLTGAAALTLGSRRAAAVTVGDPSGRP